LNTLPQNLLIVKEEDTNLILSKSNLVITFYSTVGLQAIAADKPLITVNFSKNAHPVNMTSWAAPFLSKIPKNLKMP